MWPSKKELLWLSLACLFSLSLTGYRFGSGDHLSQFPSVLHFFDPALYQKDFPLQMIFPPYLKVGLHVALFSLARGLHLPVEGIYFLVFLGTLGAIFWAALCLLKIAGTKEGLLEVALYLLVPFAVYFPALSHFKITANTLVPYQFVLPFLLWSLIFFLKERYGLASLLAAFSFLIHQQLGLILFASLSFAFLGKQFFREKKPLKTWLSLAIPFGLVFLGYFSFFYFRGSHQAYPWFDHLWGQELLEMVRFRVPHHLLFSYAGWPEKLSFFLLLFFIVWRFRHVSESPLFELGLVAFGLLILMFLGLVFTELYPLPVALNLYLFRGDVLLRLIGFCFLFSWLSQKRLSLVENLSRSKLRLSLVLFSLVYFFLGPHLRLSFPTKNEVFQMGLCLQKKTPKESLILAPPEMKGLRLYSQRSVLASFKSHGLFFSPEIAREWFRRMRLLCALPRDFSCLGAGCRELCRQNFSRLSNQDLLALGSLFEVDYLLVRRERNLDLPRVCQGRKWVVYQRKPLSSLHVKNDDF